MYHQTLRDILESAYEQLLAVPVITMNDKVDPSKWSKKEILGHLIDSAYNNHQRFLRAESQGNLIFLGYDQNEWVRKNNYQNRPLKEIMDMWLLANHHLSIVIEGIPDAILQEETTNHNFHSIGMTPIEEGTPSSLGYLIWDYIFHLEHHLGQILPDYEKQLG